MDVATAVFLASGLFLGWSLGANDAANVFGTAVATRMVGFGAAALICSLFVVLGAVLDGAGAAHTLGELGKVNALAGAFMCALAAAVTVYAMTRLALTVSTSQAIVGAIVGWNLYSGFPTDTSALVEIVAIWVASPVLAALFGVIMYLIAARLIGWSRLHLFRLDAYTRIALIVAGAFGAYALGANNIANVMGVFVGANPFTTFGVGSVFKITGVQQLFLLGALAIALGVFTYSKRVMITVGSGLFPLSPVAAGVVVLAQSAVLYLFASEGLEHVLATWGLPTIPLVPVSSSQAVVGAVIGIALLKGGHGIRWRLLASIGSGWVTTPVIAGLVCFVSLYFLENVFRQEVYRDVAYQISAPVLDRLAELGIDAVPLRELEGRRFGTVRAFRVALDGTMELTEDRLFAILDAARIDGITIDPERFAELDETSLSTEQKDAVRALAGQRFEHEWQLDEALGRVSEAWQSLPPSTVNKLHNRRLARQRAQVLQIFQR